MLEAMTIKNMPADNMSYATLVKAYCKLPQPVKAEAVLQEACKVGHLLDIGFYVSVIDAYNLVQDYNSAHRVFHEMKCRGVSPLEPILDRLLAFFEKQDKPYLMLKLLNTSARDPPLKMALYHWNRTIQVFCKGKLVSDAKASVRTMRRLGIDADANTYVFLLSGYILMGNKTNEILLLWTEIKDKLSPIDGGNPIQLTEELLAGFLTIFIKYGYFKNAMDVISKLEERNMWADKEKYKDMYWRLHRRLYTSKHRSQRRVDMSQERRRHVDAFKAWVGLPI
jgi:pentatricopeptide repeat protein